MTELTTSTPAYLNNDFFKEALDPTNKKDVVIRDLSVERNTTGGNYCSDIYRVTVKYTENSKEHAVHLLVKHLFEQMSGDSCEYFTYTKLLPAMNKILVEAGIQRAALSPNLYLARKSKDEIHVFDDMNKLGYVVCDRLVGFNFALSKKIMEKLAYFHASSMIFKRKHPEVVAQLKGFFWIDNPSLSPFIEHCIDGNTTYIADIVSKWEGFQEISKKMRRNMGDEFKRRLLAIFEPNATKLSVIVHSDLWIKNILVLENADKSVLDAVFIDYQNCYEGSPAIDINNFFMTSVQLDVLRTERDNLIEYYYNVLVDTLKKCNAGALNIQFPTLDEIRSDILRTEYFTYYDLIFAFPQTNLSEKLAKDMDYSGFYEPERLARNRADMFSNPKVLDTIKFVLRRLDDLGILD